MRKAIGFILFWIAVGMLIMFFLPHNFFTILLMIGCFVIGYNLFCCCGEK
ncbi:MAG: hypothetical protein RR364_09160 [Lachnospiraceae bacterium]